MNKVTRTVLIGALLGGGVAGALTIPLWVPAVMASEAVQSINEVVQDVAQSTTAPLFDPDDLVKFHVRADSTVSTEVSRVDTITKIEFGKKRVVRVVTTPTGVYSSDAIGDPHVRYPGIEVIANTPLQNLLRELEGIDGVTVPVYTGSFVILSVGT